DAQAVCREPKRHAARSCPARPPCQRVLGVLQDLEDKMDAIAVAIRKQRRPVLADVSTVAALVVIADGDVVGRHQPFTSSPRSSVDHSGSATRRLESKPVL